MDNQELTQLPQRLDTLVQRVPDENIEFWFARDPAIQRAMSSCAATGQNAADHFRGVTKMVCLGNRVKRVQAPKLPADDSGDDA